MQSGTAGAEALPDRPAREGSIDDYYARSPLAIRLTERRRLEIIRELCGDVRGMELAEIGSGGGHVLRMFRDARLTAIDASGVLMETARKNLAGYDVRFIKGEVERVDLPAASFDRILCTEVLQHTADPEAILAAIGRLLRPYGVAVITVPNAPLIARLKEVLRRAPLGHALRDRGAWVEDVPGLHRWGPEDAAELLGRHFRVTDRRGAPLDALAVRVCFRCVKRG